MRLLDTYAVNCGAKIDRPHILETYIPLPIEKFITFQAETLYDSRNYHYWQDVLDILYPFLLKHGITIVQAGLDKERPYKKVVDLRGKTSLHQFAYVVKNSLLYFGPDSFGVHLASMYDKPIVSIYSNNTPEISGPHFGNPKKHRLFKAYERVGNKKPSYSPQENPKSINTIRPEEIAQAVLDLLELKEVVAFETVYTGERYSCQMIRELIPDSGMALNNPNELVELRVDLHYDENIFTAQLNYFGKSMVVTDKPINLNLLRHFKSKIGMLVYRITQDDKPEFVKQVKNLGIDVLLITELSQQEIDVKKINYYELGKINILPVPDEEKIKSILSKGTQLFYRSNKFIFSKGMAFASHAARENTVVLQNEFEYSPIINCPSFWKDLSFYTIIKLK